MTSSSEGDYAATQPLGNITITGLDEPLSTHGGTWKTIVTEGPKNMTLKYGGEEADSSSIAASFDGGVLRLTNLAATSQDAAFQQDLSLCFEW